MSDNKSGAKTAMKLISEIGTEMQLEIPGLDSRLKLQLIGVLTGQYLIFNVPNKTLNTIDKKHLAAGVGVNIRCVSRGSIFGFHATINSLNRSPKILLFLSYPKEIQRQSIRKNLRVKCLLPARLIQEKIDIHGTVADISRSGCNFQVKKESLSVEQIKLSQTGQEASFALSLPGVEGEKQLQATTKSTHIDHEKVQIGIEFKNVDDAVLKIIDNFITMSFDLSPF